MPEAYETLEVEGRRVRVTNPHKVFFPALGTTKLDLVQYYLSVAPGVLAGCRDRPTLLKRYPNGIDGDFFYQKRVPEARPAWIETVTVHFPSGRSAEFLSVADAAHVAWAINLGCVDLNPWPVRRGDVDHPDELRIDIDPTPGIPWDHVRRVTMIVREALEDHGLAGFPKTSGKRGMHVNVRIEPRWEFTEVRRAALALAREVERRAPELATTAWWKEERRGVFLDYNQNARDRTVASAYSVRPVPDARVSCPLEWNEVPEVEPQDLTILTVPRRFAERGDPGAAIDRSPRRLDSLLELASLDERGGAGDPPWPPHFPKQPGEAPRVAPSRARSRSSKTAGRAGPAAEAGVAAGISARRGIGAFVRRAAPVLRGVARAAAPAVRAAAARPPGGGEADSGLVHGGDAEPGPGEEQARREPAPEVAELLAAMASVATTEAEAQALSGAATAAVVAEDPGLRPLVPHLVRGVSVLTSALRRRGPTRPAIRAVPTIVRRAAASLARLTPGPPTGGDAGRALAEVAEAVLAEESELSAAMERNIRTSLRLGGPSGGFPTADEAP